jgi:thymidine phosphorylase
MLVTDLIRAKRDRQALTTDQLRFFVAGLADESSPPEQVSAFAMAVYQNGMSVEEAGELTRAMAHSGTVLDWSDAGLDGPVVDKHSTGGVGDKVSVMLAPIAAACGCYVPMISGRGLGHTGGTTDKIESIPGYRSMPDFGLFRRVVKEAGCAIIGQTRELAPADRRFYAIRDVTGTVESIPLITASILSKKIAAGLDALVMDVKAGSGAFMPTLDDSRRLAASIIRIAASAGLDTRVLITDMNEVLGRSAGNALEIAEAMRYLRNEVREPRLDEVVLALAAEMQLAGGVAGDREQALQRAGDSIESGRAAEAFARMCSGLGGPRDFVDRYEQYLARAPVMRAVHARGFLCAVDTRAIGNSIIELGGGRRSVGQQLDLSVGYSDVAAIGDWLDAERPLAIVHAASDAAAERAELKLLAACKTGPEAPPARPVVVENPG